MPRTRFEHKTHSGNPGPEQSQTGDDPKPLKTTLYVYNRELKKVYDDFANEMGTSFSRLVARAMEDYQEELRKKVAAWRGRDKK